MTVNFGFSVHCSWFSLFLWRTVHHTIPFPVEFARLTRLVNVLFFFAAWRGLESVINVCMLQPYNWRKREEEVQGTLEQLQHDKVSLDCQNLRYFQFSFQRSRAVRSRYCVKAVFFEYPSNATILLLVWWYCIGQSQGTIYCGLQYLVDLAVWSTFVSAVQLW